MYEKLSGLPARVEVVLRLGGTQLEVVQVEVVVVVAAAGASDDLCRPGLPCFLFRRGICNIRNYFVSSIMLTSGSS